MNLKCLIPQDIVRWVRLRRILKAQKNVADFWAPIISDYFSGKIDRRKFIPKKSLDGQKIIWQYWGQGVDDWDQLPEVVRICFDSVDRYHGDYRVIRLSDTTIREYVDLPDFVYDKLENNPSFTRTFFSDLLRVVLLSTYGGVWLDATILLTGELPHQYEKMDYFMFQRSDDEPYKSYWENVYAPYFGWHKNFKVRLLNSVIFSKPLNVLIITMQDLLLYFWQNKEEIPNYFFFQILYNELVLERLSEYRCPIVNDCIPHVLQTKINGGDYAYKSYSEAIRMSNIHKMAYYDSSSMKKLKLVLEENK